MKMHAIKQLLGIGIQMKGHTSKAFVLFVAVNMLAILLTWHIVYVNTFPGYASHIYCIIFLLFF